MNLMVERYYFTRSISVVFHFRV